MITILWQYRRVIFVLLAICCTSSSTFALSPAEVLLLANKNNPKSIELAKYYMKKRKIPGTNLLKLDITGKETCSRMAYEMKVAAPVRIFLTNNNVKGRIRCILIMHGLPLRVAAPPLGKKEKIEINKLYDEKLNIEKKLKILKAEDKKKAKELQKELKRLKKKKEQRGVMDKTASLDSEIAVVLNKEYKLSGWLPNPYYIGFKGKALPFKKKDILMVSRLDGPSYNIVKRIIDDSIKAEQTGLQGTAYFAARWEEKKDKKLSAYEIYDKSIHRAAKLVKKRGIMPVVIDSTKELFRKSACPDAALYCGWYRLASYVDSFSWVPGSVGYHIASSECVTLKKKASRVWCKMMLEKGISATIGPVGEPYVQAFPVPEIFFGFLVDGYLSLAEVYIISLPCLSWKMVLIGDPLYRPFKGAYRK
jgi:uncharacterized protein (TIGR03790 family)